MEPFVSALIGFFTDLEWLVPLFISVVLQIALPHKMKVYLPEEWSSLRRDFTIGTFSAMVGISTFVASKWCWALMNDEKFQLPHLVFSFLIASVIFCLVPVFYSRMPEAFRKKYSYRAQKMKRVRLADGSEVERPEDYKSGPGEKTIYKED